jgi:hypothetical protein
MCLKEEVDADIKMITGDVTDTLEDRALLAEFSDKPYDTDVVKKLNVE